MKFIQVKVIFEDEEGIERYDGFLTDPQHAIYFEPEHCSLCLTGVIPTEKTGIYKTDSGYLDLGFVEDGQEASVIISLAKALKEMSNYDFLINVVLQVDDDIDFKELLVPGKHMAEFWKRFFRLRDKTAAELLAQKYFDDIGEKDPFKLARQLGIQLSYTELGDIVGLYRAAPPKSRSATDLHQPGFRP